MGGGGGGGGVGFYSKLVYAASMSLLITVCLVVLSPQTDSFSNPHTAAYTSHPIVHTGQQTYLKQMIHMLKSFLVSARIM